MTIPTESQAVFPKIGATSREQLAAEYLRIRKFSEALCEPLVIEDYVLQAMEDASPPRWNLAHTTWFFETLLLKKFVAGYKEVHPAYAYLFNSYYQSLGRQFSRPDRGVISRPTVREIYDYRAEIDKRMLDLISSIDETKYESLHYLVTLGVHHEQQHQELFLTDHKYNLSVNPICPRYRKESPLPNSMNGDTPSIEWIELEGGLVLIGHQSGGFCYDNELPVHKVFLEPYRIMNRLVTAGEYLEFIEDGGYAKPEYWLSDGWFWREANEIAAPLYWSCDGSEWKMFTLDGLRGLNSHEPVCHISHYEADAYANWRGARLPTEAEWEHAARTTSAGIADSNFVDTKLLHPQPLSRPPVTGELAQMHGDVWEWTASAYLPYPGYRQSSGPLGEYNGKFMNNQRVLRGGSCATSRSHYRPSYRNFFASDKRWQFSGLRLAAHQ